MKTPLTKAQHRQVKHIMGLAMDWLMAWDVTGEGKDPDPAKERVAAMLRLKDGVIGLVCSATKGKISPDGPR